MKRKGALARWKSWNIRHCRKSRNRRRNPFRRSRFWCGGFLRTDGEKAACGRCGNGAVHALCAAGTVHVCAALAASGGRKCCWDSMRCIRLRRRRHGWRNCSVPCSSGWASDPVSLARDEDPGLDFQLFLQPQPCWGCWAGQAVSCGCWRHAPCTRRGILR